MEAAPLVSVFVPSDETDGARGDTATLMKRAPAGALFFMPEIFSRLFVMCFQSDVKNRPGPALICFTLPQGGFV
jgi:hypothetical protein